MNKFALALVVVSAVSFSAFGAVSTCKSGASERKIEVTTAEGGKAPCEVKYTKEGEAEGKTLWNAQNDADYCTTKASELVGKLSGTGWECSGDITAATAEGGVPKEEAPKAEEKAVEGKTEGN